MARPPLDPMDLAGVDDLLSGDERAVRDSVRRLCAERVDPYVADWFDPRVGGHGTMDKSGSGTIYRIAPKGFKSVVPKLDLSTTEGQIAALKSPAVNVRNSGFTRLKAQGDKVVPALVELLKDSRSLLLPTNDAAIRDALLSLRSAPLLIGFRGRPAADLDALVAAIRAVADYACENVGRLLELDVNPLLVGADGAMAVDALIRLGK